MSQYDESLSGLGSSSLAHLSTSLLKKELARRQEEIEEPDARPECGSTGPVGSYNTPLHVFALVLILVLSTLACSFPIIVRRFPRLPIPHRFLFLSRHFGTGVLIATAFVHLLPTAFISLTDPCLPPFWNDRYPAMAGLIAMTAVLIVVGIEMFFAIRGAGHMHGGLEEEDASSLLKNAQSNGVAKPMLRHLRSSSLGTPSIGTPGLDQPLLAVTTPSVGDFGGRRRKLSFSSHALLDSADERNQIRADDGTEALNNEWADTATPNGELTRSFKDESESVPLNALSEDHERDSDADSVDDLDPTSLDPQSFRRRQNDLTAEDVETAGDTSKPTEEQLEQKRLLLQCLLLEAGILFHSVFIGMALSVAIGTPFIVLLIAISFHQTFEGLALGSRISAVTAFGPGSIKPWLMALAYGTTTPIGQAIGLLIHKLYDPQSETGLLMVGTMNAISSGLLLFAGLVELLAEDFLSDSSYATLQGRKRLEACGAVVAGSMLMALVGAWA